MRKFLDLKYKTRLMIILPICVVYYLGLMYGVVRLLKYIFI
jgi:hypothetical protein